MCSRFARVDMGRNDEEPGNLGRAEKGVILPGFLGSAGHALLRPPHRVLLNKRSESCYPFRRRLLVESPPIRAPWAAVWERARKLGIPDQAIGCRVGQTLLSGARQECLAPLGQGGRGVAFRWRIRHKLMFGLGLVVAIITVLLGGALYGLWSYRATMKSIESKLAEQDAAQHFKAMVHSFADLPDETGSQNPFFKLLQRIKDAEDALNSYEDKLQDTLNRGRDPDMGEGERAQLDALRGQLSSLRES